MAGNKEKTLWKKNFSMLLVVKFLIKFNGYNKKSWIYYWVWFEQFDDDCIIEKNNNENNDILMVLMKMISKRNTIIKR